MEDARVSVKLFGPAFAIEHVMPRKIAGTWHPKEGIPCKPPIEVTRLDERDGQIQPTQPLFDGHVSSGRSLGMP